MILGSGTTVVPGIIHHIIPEKFKKFRRSNRVWAICIGNEASQQEKIWGNERSLICMTATSDGLNPYGNYEFTGEVPAFLYTLPRGV